MCEAGLQKELQWPGETSAGDAAAQRQTLPDLAGGTAKLMAKGKAKRTAKSKVGAAKDDADEVGNEDGEGLRRQKSAGPRHASAVVSTAHATALPAPNAEGGSVGRARNPKGPAGTRRLSNAALCGGDTALYRLVKSALATVT